MVAKAYSAISATSFGDDALLSSSDVLHESTDGRYKVLFHGRIVNRRELDRELTVFLGPASRRSDAERVLAAWTRWGDSSPQHIEGSFTFGLWDRDDGILYLVRDRFGSKPLYYAFVREGLSFALDISPLLELAGVSRRVHPARLYQYLRTGITDNGQETMFRDVRQVPAAHYLRVPLHNPYEAVLVRYSTLEPMEPLRLKFKDAAERLREMFLDSVRQHMGSATKLGAMLSGGIDSSSVLCAMRYLEPDLDLRAVSFIADGSPLSEERYIDVVAAAVGVRVDKVRIAPTELVAELDSLVRIQGEPFISTSIYAQYRVFRRAKELGIELLFDGQGADEVLGGYVGFAWALLASLLHQRRWKEAVSLQQALSRYTTWWRPWLQTVRTFLPSPVVRFAQGFRTTTSIPRWIRKEWFLEREVDLYRLQERPRERHLRNELLRAINDTSLPMLLRFEERNGRAHGVAGALPFLSTNLVHYTLSMPEEYLLSLDGTTKALFRAAMRGIVPDSILDRKDKIGFSTPEQDWLRDLSPWVESQLAEGASVLADVLHFDVIKSEWEQTKQGSSSSAVIWRCLNVLTWLRVLSVSLE